jgi:hypothetical protein
VKFAPRIAERVRSEIERLAVAPLTPAEITRIAGATAEELGFRRPSYEQVRVLVRDYRARRRELAEDLRETGQFLVDYLYRPWQYQHSFPDAPPRRRRK